MANKQNKDMNRPSSGGPPQTEASSSEETAARASFTGNDICTHEDLVCGNSFELLPVFECSQCSALLICECEIEWFERFDPSRLSRRVFNRTTGRMEEAIPARNVCYSCRGVEEPYAPKAYGRHLFSRKKWRAIFKRHIELLAKYHDELEGLRSQVELAERHLRTLIWPDVEAGRFGTILRQPISGKPLKQVAPEWRGTIESKTWSTISDLLLAEFRRGVSLLAGERLRALEELSTHLSAYRTRLDEIERKAENQIRQAAGVPLIGQGWITETELFNLVKHLFAPSLVIQHARLPWLGRQHLDIYVPDYALAIEYMGEQHYESIEHFGGEEGLHARQELDRRKRELCRRHGVHLVEVKPDDEISLSSMERILERYVQRTPRSRHPA